MKAFIVIASGRQVEGEFTFVRVEKGFLSAAQADGFRDQLQKSYIREDGSPKNITISTQYGDIDCHCVASAFEVEIEETNV